MKTCKAERERGGDRERGGERGGGGIEISRFTRYPNPISWPDMQGAAPFLFSFVCRCKMHPMYDALSLSKLLTLLLLTVTKKHLMNLVVR